MRPENATSACPTPCCLLARLIAVAALVILSGCARLHPPSQAARPPVFAVVADIQYGDKDPAGTRHFRTALRKLEECVSDLERRDLAFVIQLGDIVEGDEKDSAKSAKDLDAVLRVFKRVKAPLYHVVGNHCLRVGKERLRQRLGLRRFYYDFTARSAPGWRFIVLDGNDAGYGIVSDEQLAWFRAILARSAARGERVICFCHYALLKEAARDHRMARPEPLLETLDRAGCVVAWFAGHDHAGGYSLRRGVHHLTFKGMVETPDQNAYAFIELGPDRLCLDGAVAESSRQLDLGTGNHLRSAVPR